MPSVRLTKTDLRLIEKSNDQLSQIDKNLVDSRKQSIFSTLSAATEARMKHIGKIQGWIDQMETRVFNPVFIADLSPEKTIALFKYINNLNLKALAESGKLEFILTNYINSGAMEMNAEITKQNIQKVDITQLKHDIMGKLSSLLKTNISDAHIVNQTEDEKDFDEDIKHITKDTSTEITDELPEEVKDQDDEMKNLDMALDNLDL